jgi:hypothetical protein
VIVLLRTATSRNSEVSLCNLFTMENGVCVYLFLEEGFVVRMLGLSDLAMFDAHSLLSLRVCSSSFLEAATKYVSSVDVSNYFVRSVDFEDAWFQSAVTRRPKKRQTEENKYFHAVFCLFKLFPRISKVRFDCLIMSDLDVTLLIKAVALAKQSCLDSAKLTNVIFNKVHFEREGCLCCRGKQEKDSQTLWIEQLATPTFSLQMKQVTFHEEIRCQLPNILTWFQIKQ